MAEALQKHQQHEFGHAEGLYQQILVENPTHADALHLYGCLCDDLGRLDDAIDLVTRAVKSNPKAHPYFFNLANMLFKKGQLSDAAQKYRVAIWLKNDYSVAHNNLGLVLCKMGDRTGGKASFQQAIRFRSGYAEPHNNLGIALKEEGELAQAVTCYREALRIRPDYADAYYNLGNAYAQLRLPGEAVKAYTDALRLRPNPRAYNNLGGELIKLGRIEEGSEAFEKALHLDSTDILAISNLIAARCYATQNPVDIYAQCVRWSKATEFASVENLKLAAFAPVSGRRLRIGYVSADFRHHAAAYWIEPLLAAHDHSKFEIYCYSNSDTNDAVTERFKRLADVWVECSSMNDSALVNRIRHDSINLLVDLSGHTDGNRLAVFARKPAPIQVSWFGFPVSTGVKAIDYRFTDRCIDPVGEFEHCYSEQLFRLKRFYAAFRPESNAPEVGPSPHIKNGFITYASLNSLSKITPTVYEMWAKILCAVPNSRLLMQAIGLEDELVVDNLKHFFATQGVEHQRLILRGWTGIADFLSLGNEADIALDPFPFNGGVTTCHALWMGLPLVTMRGQSAASRIGHSLLHYLGLDDWVASAQEHYIDLAVDLGQNSSRLIELRSSMRSRMSNRGLLDGAALTQEVESAYQEFWEHWCSTHQR